MNQPFDIKTVMLSAVFLMMLQLSANAQPLSTHLESLEAKIAGSHTVLLGTIESMKQSAVDYNFKPVKKTDPNGFVELEIAVRVIEVLKGKANSPVAPGWKVFARTYDANKRYSAWQKAKTELIFFYSDPRKGYSPFSHGANAGSRTCDVLRVGAGVEEERGFGRSLSPPIYLSNLIQTSDTARIIKRAREYGKTSRGVVKKHSLHVPSIVLAFADGFVFWNSVTVPVDDDLNQFARRMIERPESVVPKNRKPDKTETYQIRFSGVDALQHFETKSNVTLLRSLVAEPYVEIKRAPPRDQTVSSRAFEVLLGWGRDDGSVPVSSDKITSLHLDGKNISDKTAQTLSRLANLRELVIDNSSLTASGFAKLIDLDAIELLNVDQHLLSDEILKVLRSKKSFYKTKWANAYQDERPDSDDEVSHLLFDGSKHITDAAIDEIGNFKDQLVTIDLRGTAITDRGLAKLQDFRSLRRISITETRVTKIGVDKLQTALPKCHIYSAFTNTVRQTKGK